MMRQPLVAGNWKMHGTRASVSDLVGGIRHGMGGDIKTDVVVCPPYVHLAEVGRALNGTSIKLGAQNLCAQTGEGAYTGEISGAMLKDMDCRYVIVGHSERRALYGETDEVVAKKFVAAGAAGLMPILCVGELLKERERGETEDVIARQLDAVLNQQNALTLLTAFVIAYEPVWAIGTGRTATPAQAQEVHAFIRARIAKRDKALAEKMRIVYGGSVKAGNAAELFAMEDIDGGLIGGASLDAAQFLTICRAAS